MPKALFLDKTYIYHIVPVKPYLLVNLPVNRWSGKIQKLKALIAPTCLVGSCSIVSDFLLYNKLDIKI